jgi:hypothetical protein
MCLTAEALAVFLNLLDPSIVTTAPGRITVNAAERPAVWVVSAAELWCTSAPALDRDARFERAQ